METFKSKPVGFFAGEVEFYILFFLRFRIYIRKYAYI